jgi:hypothetical protein
MLSASIWSGALGSAEPREVPDAVPASVGARYADRAKLQATVSITKHVKVIRQVFMILSFRRLGPPFAEKQQDAAKWRPFSKLNTFVRKFS